MAADCVTHPVHLPGVYPAKGAKVIIIAAIGEEFGNGKLCR
jgi:hypothetical protein